MKSATTILALLLVSGCEIFVSGVGGVDQPCFGDGTCKPGLICIDSGQRCKTAFVKIEGGSYKPGNSTSEEKVDTFYIMDREVTLAWYDQCVKNGPCTPPKTGGDCNWGEEAERNEGNHKPINCITWSQAREFCHWQGFRLPTELEWEFAARNGGQDITYPWGNTAPDCNYCNFSGCGPNSNNALRKSCDLSYGKTQAGVCDLAGNVSEFVEDVMNAFYTPPCNQGQHVVRGGAYVDGSGHCGVGDRGCVDHDQAKSTVGFRCAWDYELRW